MSSSSRAEQRDHMERVTFRIPKPLLADLEESVDAGRYPNRSEALRDAARQLVDDEPEGWR